MRKIQASIRGHAALADKLDEKGYDWVLKEFA